MGDFAALRIGTSALLAQRRALDVNGHNIANANTEGYSRQRVDLVAKTGPTLPSMFARTDGSGMGVDASSTLRLRDQFLDVRSYQEHATGESLSQTQQTLSRIEMAFGEPGDNGLATQINDFLAAWDDVANRPDDMAARGQLVELGRTVTAGFSQLDSALAALSQSTVQDLQATISEVNSFAAGIADLNRSIASSTTAGFAPNDLMDQRDLLVAKLADRLGVTVRPGDQGSVDVYLGGVALVRGDRANALGVDLGTTASPTTRVVWNVDGTTANVSGSAGGMLSAINDLVPRYRSQLSAVASTLANDVNAVHTTGFDLDGNAGQAFFTIGPNGIAVNAAITADPRKIAASSSATAGRDGSIASKLAALTSPLDQYRGVILGLGVETQAVNRRVDVQASITKQVDLARDSVSGVNLDEEMSDMVAIQHAYEAAARFISAVDQTLDTLINNTGLVGR